MDGIDKEQNNDQNVSASPRPILVQDDASVLDVAVSWPLPMPHMRARVSRAMGVGFMANAASDRECDHSGHAGGAFAMTEIPDSVRQAISTHRAFYDVSAHLIVLEERRPGAVPNTRRIQAGFDIDVYGAKTSNGSRPSPEYELGYGMLKRVTEAMLANMAGSCSIEVIPFRSTTILDTKNHFEPLDLIRIAITCNRGLDQPAGAAEQEALKAVEEQLNSLGIRRA